MSAIPKSIESREIKLIKGSHYRNLALELDSQGDTDTLLTGSEDSQTPKSQRMTGSQWMRAIEKWEESSKTRDPTQ